MILEKKMPFGIVVMTFLSILFSQPSFAMSKKRDFQLDVLTLEATLYLVTYAADVGAAWTHDRPNLEETPFDRQSGIAARLASGAKALGAPNAKAAELVSKETNWGPWYPIPLTVTSGRRLAEMAAYQLDWENIYHATIKAATDVAQRGGTPEEVGMASAKEAFRFAKNMENSIQEKIREKVYGNALADQINPEDIVKTLKAPIDTEEFKKALPEIQDFYISYVQKLESEAKQIQAYCTSSLEQ